nr:AMP-binding protein [uncultured Brevundimonas sp.]
MFLPQMFVQSLESEPTKPRLKLQDGTVLTAAALAEITSLYQQAFASLGLPAGSVIGILSSNRPEVLHVTHAAMLNRHVMVALHPRGSLDDHEFVLEDAQVDALVFDEAFAERVAALRERRRRPTRWLSLGAADGGAIDLLAAVGDLVARPLLAPPVDPEDVTRYSYSGGTTGRPKAIIGTQEYQRAMMQIMMAEWEWPREVRHLVCAPLSHAGLAGVLPTLLRGGCAHILREFDPLEVMRTIERERITCVLLVPTMIYALLDHPQFGEFDLSSLETIFYGASPMSPARLREGIEKLGPVFFQFYGQAEAPMTIMVMRRDEHRIDDLDRLAGCGRPTPWLEVALLDDAMRPTPTGVPGEVCVRGPIVMAGYLNMSEQTAEAFAGGWLHTGDIAVRNADGFYRIVDRKKDMIVTGGYNVYAREVEDAVGLHPSVAQCAVIGVPDDYWGEAIKAVVRLRDGATDDPDTCAREIIALVRRHKGGVQTPKIVEFVDTIPMTPVGKPDKKALRAAPEAPAADPTL